MGVLPGRQPEKEKEKKTAGCKAGLSSVQLLFAPHFLWQLCQSLC